MTKKDYIILAAIINQYSLNNPAPGTFDEGYHAAAYGIACDLADTFEKENPRFNRALFLTACGFEG